MACVSLELSIAVVFFVAAVLLFREYQHMKGMNALKSENDELRNAIYALQREEKNFRERDFKKLLSDFNKLKERADEIESEYVKLKRKLGKEK
ncbi:MAG: hypothetical protein QXF56_01030 [Candidatus Micrarchaeia archaeon]